MTICYVISLLLLILSEAFSRSSLRNNLKNTKTTIGPNNSTQNTNITIDAAFVTWNLAESSPNELDCQFLKNLRNKDMVVIGVQECEDLRPRRHEGRRSRAWRTLQINSLGNTFETLVQDKIGGIQLAVYVKKKLKNRISGVLVLDVACGIGNMLNNKGAICALIRLNKKTLALVNGHFAAHTDKVNDRNADYARVTQSIINRAPILWLKKNSPVYIARKRIAKEARRKRAVKDKYSDKSFSFESMLSAAGIPPDTHGGSKEKFETSVSTKLQDSSSTLWPFDAVVFIGDLNYRLNIPRLEVEMLKEKIEKNKMLSQPSNIDYSNGILDYKASKQHQILYDKLQIVLNHDQLYQERQRKKVFLGFKEGKISFLPTFKYDKRSNAFDSSSKYRCPAYCDRILYYYDSSSSSSSSPNSNLPLLVLKDYFSIDSRHSDHRPVIAHFNINL